MGVYLGEIITTTESGAEAMVVPVTLQVNSTTATATPTFTHSVTIVDTTSDAVIDYTLDGSSPTTTSARYSAPQTGYPCPDGA